MQSIYLPNYHDYLLNVEYENGNNKMDILFKNQNTGSHVRVILDASIGATYPTIIVNNIDIDLSECSIDYSPFIDNFLNATLSQVMVKTILKLPTLVCCLIDKIECKKLFEDCIWCMSL